MAKGKGSSGVASKLFPHKVNSFPSSKFGEWPMDGQLPNCRLIKNLLDEFLL